MLSALGLLAGKYRLVRELGRGAFGAVYAARVEPEGQPVALKLLARFDEGRSVERFRREAQVLARIPPHPNIVRVLDAGEHGGLPFVVMELVRGGSLARALADGRRPTVAQAARLVEKIALGLDHLHRAGVVHRDVNANNVLIEEGGEPRLVDFGLALDKERVTRLTTTGELLGTPLAFAPEQLEGKGEEIGPEVDIYAASALLYELVTGKPPFADARSFGELVDRIRHEVPERASQVNPEVPEPLALAIEKGLAKSPADRPPSAAELARLVGEGARAEARPAAAAPPRPPRPATAAPPSEPPAPRRVGVYDVLAPLARTHHGTIHTARHAQLGRALSVLVSPVERAPDLAARPRVAHPNVAALYESGVDAGVAYLGLEAVAGSVVTEIRANGGPLAARRALDVASQVARALSALRERGAAPATLHSWDVLLDPGGHAKLLPENPAVAASPTLDARAGSAPETQERPADARTDVWNAGKVLFHSIAAAGADDDGLARAAQAIARRAGAPDPDERFPDALAFSRACEEALERASGPAAPGAAPSRHTLAVLGGVVVAFVLVVVATGALWRRHVEAALETELRAEAASLLAQARERARTRPGEVRALVERSLGLATPAPSEALDAAELLLSVGEVEAAKAPLAAASASEVEALALLDLTEDAVVRGVALAGEPARRLAALPVPEGAGPALARRRALVQAARARVALDGALDAAEVPALAASLAATGRDDPPAELLEAWAEVDLVAGTPAAAEAHATAALARHGALGPRDPRAVPALAARLAARLELDRLEPALADADALLGASPSHTRGHALRAIARARLGDEARAREDLTAALGAPAPGSPLVALDRARAALELGDPRRALEDLERALAAAPRWPPPSLEKARALAAADDLDASLRQWEAARTLAPREPRAWTGTAEALLRRRRAGDVERARDALEHAVALEARSPHALVLRGAVEQAAGELAAAEPFLDRACELEPPSPEAVRERGRLRWRRGDARGARADLERAAGLAPRDAASHAALALVLGPAPASGAAAGDPGPVVDGDGALAHWAAALEAPRLEPRRRAVWFARRSALRLARREVRVALEDCTRALDLAPDEPRALAARARARAAQGDPRGALKDARAALERERAREQAPWPHDLPELEPGETAPDLVSLVEKLSGSR